MGSELIKQQAITQKPVDLVLLHICTIFLDSIFHMSKEAIFSMEPEHWASLMGFEDFRDPAIYNLFSNVGLTICGTSERPFDIKQWNIHPHGVFKRLSE